MEPRARRDGAARASGTTTSDSDTHADADAHTHTHTDANADQRRWHVHDAGSVHDSRHARRVSRWRLDSRAQRGAARADTDANANTHADAESLADSGASSDKRWHVRDARSVHDSGHARRMPRRRMGARAERGTARADTISDADANTDADSNTHTDADAHTGADQRRHVLVTRSVLDSGDARRMSRWRMDSRAKQRAAPGAAARTHADAHTSAARVEWLFNAGSVSGHSRTPRRVRERRLVSSRRVEEPGHFRVACRASDTPDCERAEGERLKNGAQGGDRRVGVRDPT